MNITTLIFDIDGVLNNPGDEYFSTRYAREYGISEDQINEFFQGRFELCSLGQADLKVEIEPYLKKWGWESSVDDYLDKWFKEERNIDENMIQIVKNLKKNGYNLHLATQQEQYRTNYIWEEMGFKTYFENIFATCTLKIEKSNPKFFETILEKIKKSPSEVIYTDDKQKIVDTAKVVGINAFQFVGIEDLKNKFNQYEINLNNNY